MTIRTRRIIYLFFIIFFLIVAPTLILYAQGYRYNFKKWKIQKTGMIFLTSKQKGASVYLNNKLYPQKIDKNLTIKNLLPDEYLVRVEKEGYYPWQKKLNVYSRETTFTNDAILFKRGVPQNLVLGRINWINFSKDRKKIIYLFDKKVEQELWLINLETNKSMLLYKLPLLDSDKIENINWAASLKKILINIKKNNKKIYLVLNIERPEKIISLSDFTSSDFNQIKWDENSDNILYGIKGNKIYQIDLVTQKLTPLIELEIGLNDNLVDYLIKNEFVYYIKTNKISSFILKERLENKEKFISRIKLTKSLNYHFIEGNNRFLTILDKEKQNLFLINSEFFENIAFTNKNEYLINRLEAKNALWQPASNQLLYYNDFEIWIYNLDSNKKEIVNRYSEAIEEVIWYPNYEYLIALINNEIRILEISNQEKNIVNLIKLDKINSLNIDKEGEKLYFLGQIGKQEGLYELVL